MALYQTPMLRVKGVNHVDPPVLDGGNMAKAAVHELDVYVGRRIKKLRDERNITASRLAEIIGATQQQISRYENGQNKLAAVQLYRLACALGVPISWFFLDYLPTDNDDSLQCLAEPGSQYEASVIADQLDIIRAQWSHLPTEKRTALLRMMDALL